MSAGRRALAPLVMLLGVLAVYCPPVVLGGGYTLWGGDFGTLHVHRIRFAQEALFGAAPRLPAWYPREFLGTPFWANLQSFPWLPTRLVLLPLDAALVHLVGVNLAAALAALFTFLWARRIGLGPVAAAASGWTFACAGYFASRVLAGHLPLLEAYPSLPLLLWVADRAIEAGPGRAARQRRLLALAAASFAVVLAGHPQLGVYALAVTALSLVWHRPGRGALRPLVVLAAGAGAASFVLWPMARLVARSTRTLALRPAENDIPFPVERLGAWLLPWRDGWPEAVLRPGPPFPFQFSRNPAYFWDTVCYVGVLPLVAVLALALYVLWRRRVPRVAAFVAVVALVAFALSLVDVRRELAPLGLFLRSPARLVYLVTFALALALGTALDLGGRALAAAGVGRLRGPVLAALLLAHGADLADHAWSFVRPMPVALLGSVPVPAAAAVDPAGSRRVAVDYFLSTAANRRVDDVGVFDSLVLRDTYRGVLALAGLPADANVQALDGSELHRRALGYAGVARVVTVRTRDDLPLLAAGAVRVYAVPDAAPRADFVAADRARALDDTATLAALRDPRLDLARTILLPVGVGGPAAGGGDESERATEPRPGSAGVRASAGGFGGARRGPPIHPPGQRPDHVHGDRARAGLPAGEGVVRSRLVGDRGRPPGARAPRRRVRARRRGAGRPPRRAARLPHAGRGRGSARERGEPRDRRARRAAVTPARYVR